MGQRYFIHFRIFENKREKQFVFSEKKAKKQKKSFWIVFLENFPTGIFTIWLPPIRTPVNVFRMRKLGAFSSKRSACVFGF